MTGYIKIGEFPENKIDDPLFADDKFQVKDHHHIGLGTIIADNLLMTFSNKLLHQKVISIFLILSAIGLFIVKIGLLIILFSSLNITQTIHPLTKISQIIMAIVLISKEIYYFYEIEAIYRKTSYSWHHYGIAIFDLIQIILFKRLMTIGILFNMLHIKDPILIIVTTSIFMKMTRLDDVFRAWCFSETDDSRFIQRSLIETPTIEISYIIHTCWIIGLSFTTFIIIIIS